MMVTAAEHDVSTSRQGLGSEYEALVQQAMAVPEVARAMEAYANLERYQMPASVSVQQISYAAGGNTSAASPTNAPAIPFGIGTNR